MILAKIGLLIATNCYAFDVDPVRMPEVLDTLNKRDPVSGKTITVGSSVDWHGVRVHFESAETAKKFLGAPAKYVRRLKFRVIDTKRRSSNYGTTLLSLENKKCPVTGRRAKKGCILVREGLQFRLSSNDVACEVRKDPKACYARLGYAFVPSYVDLRNTTCPVTRKRIAASRIWAEHDDIRVRLLSRTALVEFKKTPVVFLKSFGVDLAKLKKRAPYDFDGLGPYKPKRG